MVGSTEEFQGQESKEESVLGEESVVITGGSLSEYEEFKKAAISNIPEDFFVYLSQMVSINKLIT